MTNTRGNFNCALLAVCLLSAVMNSFSATVDRVTNDEYKFSVSFPNDAIVCMHMSGEIQHGFYILFSEHPLDCNRTDPADKSTSAIGVYAYANSSFEFSPEEELAGLCGKDHKLKDSGFNGRRSAACEVTDADGAINIYVVTQAGEWPNPHDSPELKSPFINYTASLRTNTKRRAIDLDLFRQVLNSVSIYYPK